MSKLGRRLVHVERRVAVRPIPPDNMSHEDREVLIRTVFDESLAISLGKRVERVESARTDLSQHTLQLICNLAEAIRMPMECVLPNLFKAAVERDTDSSLRSAMETIPNQGDFDGYEKSTKES